MERTFSTWYGILLLIVALSSCEGHRIPQAQRFRIKTIRTTIPDPVLTTHARLVTEVYDYDSNDRLVKSVSSGETNPISVPDSSRTIVNYDAQGRIDNAVYEIWALKLNASGYIHLWSPAHKTTYEHNINDNISVVKEYTINVFPTGPSLVSVFQLAYNGAKAPIKVTSNFGSIGGPNLGQSVEHYTYSGGNVIKQEKSDNQSATVTTTYRYDDKPNPFYGLITEFPNISIFSRNNVITNDKQCTYDSNGLLTKVVLAGGIVETYEYEAY